MKVSCCSCDWTFEPDQTNPATVMDQINKASMIHYKETKKWYKRRGHLIKLEL